MIAGLCLASCKSQAQIEKRGLLEILPKRIGPIITVAVWAKAKGKAQVPRDLAPSDYLPYMRAKRALLK